MHAGWRLQVSTNTSDRRRLCTHAACEHATRPCDLSGPGSTCNTVRSPTARCAISTGGRLVFGWSLSSDGTLEGPRSVGAGIGTSAYSSSAESNK